MASSDPELMSAESLLSDPGAEAVSMAEFVKRLASVAEDGGTGLRDDDRERRV